MMLLISISRLSMNIGGHACISPNGHSISPSGEATLALEQGPKSSGVLTDGGVRREAQRSRAVAEPPPQVSVPLDLGSAGARLRSLDGRALESALVTLGRSVSDLFPANKIFTHCSKCGIGVERFKGYKHYKVGDHGTYCRICHEGMGLPLRDDE